MVSRAGSQARLARPSLYACLLAGAGCAATFAQAQPVHVQVARSYDIPAGALADALNSLVEESGTQILYDATLTTGRTVAALKGAMSTTEALSRLLDGTGLTFRQTGPRSYTLQPLPQSEDASIQLGTLRVQGAVDGGTAIAGARGDGDGKALAEAPYHTAGSSNYVSREQMDRVAPTSPGDIFIGVPGVVNSGTNIGASLNVNIRGMQGMGRVATTIDGSHQTSTAFRGYPGSRDETYVDPDMIGSIEVGKGPAVGVGGGTGGSVALRTLAAQDIVPDGESWAVRVRGSLGGNTDRQISNAAADPEWVIPQSLEAHPRPGLLDSDAWSGSIALGVRQTNFEAIAAYSQRRQGNYFSGKNAPDDMRFATGNYAADLANAHSSYQPDSEVFNTSQNVESLLLKARLIWGDGESLELGYMLYDSQHGELNDNANTKALPPLQYRLTNTDVHTYTARYRSLPGGDPLLRLRANLFYTDLSVNRGGISPTADHGMKTFGGDIDNTSLIDSGWGLLTVNLGAEYRRERASAHQEQNFGRWTSWGPAGIRAIGAAFAHAQLEPLPWMTLTGGLRQDVYRARGEGYAAAYPTKSGARLSPNASVLVSPWQGLQLYASYKEGMRAPNLREMYWNYLQNVSINPDLEPEVSKSREIGMNIFRDGILSGGDNLRFKIAYYDNVYRNYIQTMPVKPYTYEYHFANIEKARHEGIDITAKYDAGWLFGELAYNRFLAIETCTAQDGCRLAEGDVTPIMGPPDFANYRPAKASGSATVGVRLFDRALTLGGRVRFSSTRYGSKWPPAPNQSLGFGGTWPGYDVFDLFGSAAITKDTSFNVSIENVGDRYYLAEASTTGIPSPGRTARIALTQRFGGAQSWLPHIPAISPGRASWGMPGEDWTGVYAGVHTGYASADVSGQTVAEDGRAIAATESADYRKGRGQIGLHLGVNYQLPGRVVVGLEGDRTALGHKSALQDTLATESATLAAAGHLEAQTRFGLESLATLRARIGYAPGRTLFYATGGRAFLNEYGERNQYQSESGSVDLPFGDNTHSWFAETDDLTRTGWTGGGGIEHAIGRHFSIKAEFLHAAFGGRKALSFEHARAGVGVPYNQVREFEVCFEEEGENYCYIDAETTRFRGTSEDVVPRRARNRTILNSLRVGVSYRF